MHSSVIYQDQQDGRADIQGPEHRNTSLAHLPQ